MDKAQDLAEQAWTAYRYGQISADHTAKDVFCEVVRGLLTRGSTAPQPPSASGEWAAFRSACWTKATEPAIGHMHGQDAAWWGWMARAALAPSPGVDAAEQKPVYTIQVRGALHTWEPTAQAFKLTNGTYNLYAAPSPAASADEWMAEAEALLDAYAASIRRFVMNQEVAKHQAGCRAALLAHLKAWP